MTKKTKKPRTFKDLVNLLGSKAIGEATKTSQSVCWRWGDKGLPSSEHSGRSTRYLQIIELAEHHGLAYSKLELLRLSDKQRKKFAAERERKQGGGN